jgi:hypothetical protein
MNSKFKLCLLVLVFIHDLMFGLSLSFVTVDIKWLKVDRLIEA